MLPFRDSMCTYFGIIPTRNFLHLKAKQNLQHYQIGSGAGTRGVLCSAKIFLSQRNKLPAWTEFSWTETQCVPDWLYLRILDLEHKYWSGFSGFQSASNIWVIVVRVTGIMVPMVINGTSVNSIRSFRVRRQEFCHNKLQISLLSPQISPYLVYIWDLGQIYAHQIKGWKIKWKQYLNNKHRLKCGRSVVWFCGFF